MKKIFSFENVKGSWLTTTAGVAAIVASFTLLFTKPGFGWQEAGMGLATGFALLGLKDPEFFNSNAKNDADN